MNRRCLHWSYLNYKEIPMDLYSYEDLEEVYLKENYIAAIPKWFLNLTNLKFIHLAGNNLTQLPEELYLLENLEFLDVSNNQLQHLPSSIGYMLNLLHLNVSSNELTDLPKTLTYMKRLESLNISKNKLKRIPQFICECSRLNELNLSENTEIWHIPERVANMPSLQMLSADKCSLIYLPVALAKFLDYLRIFNNSAITHIPIIYEKFYQNYFETPTKSPHIPVTHSDFFWVVEKETFKKLLLPIGTKEIFPVPSKENQVTLYDDCLKTLENLNRLMPFYENPALKYMLPEKCMVNHIRNGPTGRCTVFKCSNPLFTTYYFMVVKRRGSTSRQIFTCYFCTMYCANVWLNENNKKYYCIDWEIYEEPME
ncbi:protein lap1-like [Musca vetustissima]|uniref:protein lap1-like n=1 Tax=Musca vetustissima TaxID=27455 RepID=UPI002AB79033|nr:protein lap1-like [Musca vetustissima]